MTHEIQLNGYSATCISGGSTAGYLRLGTYGGYGNEYLHITTDESWEGLAITATFVNGPTNTRMLVDIQGNVRVPSSAVQRPTLQGKLGKIIFSGTAAGMRRINVELPFFVGTQDAFNEFCNCGCHPTEPSPLPPPPSPWEQFVQEVKEDREAAELAAHEAKLAAENAALEVEGLTANVDAANKVLESFHQEIDDFKEQVTANTEALKNKVDAIDGKGLSDNDFTDKYRDALDRLIENQAQAILRILADGVPLEPVDGVVNIPGATAEVAGLVKSSTAVNGIKINEDRTMEIGSISMDKLKQPTDEVVIISGGGVEGW